MKERLCDDKVKNESSLKQSKNHSDKAEFIHFNHGHIKNHDNRENECHEIKSINTNNCNHSYENDKDNKSKNDNQPVQLMQIQEIHNNKSKFGTSLIKRKSNENKIIRSNSFLSNLRTNKLNQLNNEIIDAPPIKQFGLDTSPLSNVLFKPDNSSKINIIKTLTPVNARKFSGKSTNRCNDTPFIRHFSVK